MPTVNGYDISPGADLRGADLQGADLRGADLQGAYLQGAYLQGAYLRRADLRGAYLQGAYLPGADLRGADLREADLQGAYLRRADLRGAYLQGAYLPGADLREADLQGATGNMEEVKSLQLDTWPVTYTSHVVQIGCQRHALEKWWAFNDDEINNMDPAALAWWKTWKPILRQIIEVSPARPTED